MTPTGRPEATVVLNPASVAVAPEAPVTAGNTSMNSVNGAPLPVAKKPEKSVGVAYEVGL